MNDEAIVKGRLTCRTNGKTIVKMQFGNKDVIYKKELDKAGNRVPLSIGNDLKAAATDCLKKCAAEIGIAADIYNAEEFREITVEAKTLTPESPKWKGAVQAYAKGEATIEAIREKFGLSDEMEQQLITEAKAI